MTEWRIHGGNFAAVVNRTVAVQFFRGALETARLNGFDVRGPLREARITPELLGRDATRVTRTQATRLVQALWNATDDELLGVGPQPVPRGTFRMVALAVIHAPDLGTATQRLAEFTSIATGFETVEQIDDGQITRLSFDPGSRTRLTDQLISDVVLSIAHRFSGWLIGQRITLDSVELRGVAPPHVAEYPLIYGIAPTFGASTAAMTFDSRYLRAPLVRSEDELLEFIRRSPNDLLFRQDYNPTTSSRVRKIIERARTDEAVTADDVARRLSMSVQHLRRLLHDEETSFRQIKEEILRDAAIAGLVRGRETVEELSGRLGFSEPSAFRRAFRRWTGSPPGSYRPSANTVDT